MAEEMNKNLNKKRGAIKAQLTRFKNYLDRYAENPESDQLSERLEKIRETWSAFDNVQTEIELLDETTDHSIEREAFGTAYFDVTPRARHCLAVTQPTHDQTRRSEALASVSQNATMNAIKLPTINLPSFNGDYDNWLVFHDNFKAIIHNNSDIMPVQKLQYLKSCLKGNASQVIESLSTSDQNYEIAWNLLVERYDNHRIIIQSHVRALFELPSVTKESAVQLRTLLDNALKHIRMLKSLKQPTESWDAMILHLITSKLDKGSHREWENSINGTEMPSIDQLWKFLRNRCHMLENVTQDIPKQIKDSNRYQNVRSNTVTNNRPHQSYITVQNKLVCAMCKKEHQIQDCEQFLKLDNKLRYATVKEANLCFNCLRGKHSANFCKSGPCRKCKRRHHTLLHLSDGDIRIQPSTSNEVAKEAATTNLHAIASSQVLLSTAKAQVTDRYGKQLTCKVLLDSGSQSNFMTESFAERLELSKKNINIPVSGFNRTMTYIKQAVTTNIRSSDGRFQANLDFLIVPKITEKLPVEHVNHNKFSIPNNIILADPEFCKPSEVNILIGAEIFYSLLCTGQIKLENSAIILQKTKLGWIISGRVPGNDKGERRSVCNLSIDALTLQVNKFWELEQVPQAKHWSVEERACEEHFKKHTFRDESGRYNVRLPFNKRKSELGESYQIALKRFHSIENKLIANNNLRKDYTDFLHEYINLGHMFEVCDEKTKNEGYFMPHHAVLKKDSLTTKLRVVYDASCKTETGVSLNDTLMVGPNIQEDVFSIVTRFRTHRYVLTADVEKMYRQVKIHPEDQKYQKIVWRENKHANINVYQLETVTYGTAAASFLATRCLHQLAEDEANQFPLAVKILKQDFYVDDLLTGTRTIEEAEQLQDQLIKLLRRGGFNLRQWASNEPKLVEAITKKFSETTIRLNGQETMKALGICWHPVKDIIYYTINYHEIGKRVTKRNILAQIASLFDPLGLLGPTIVKAKIILQQLWYLKLEWDEAVPLEMETTWKDYKRQLIRLNDFSIPRKILIDESEKIQLHGFCDSSEKAFGACIYLRSMDSKNNCLVRLVCSKSRVAPMKNETLPRLELCAALLLSKLYEATRNSLRLNFEKICFWSDSTIVIHWIRTSPHKLKTFVANRVAQIQLATNIEDWRHVTSEDNPADILSRGQQPAEFVSNSAWINGPEWLSRNERWWPKNILPHIEVPECKAIVSLKIEVATNILDKFSSTNKLKRVIAYCRRFIHNCANKNKLSGRLSVRELCEAMECVIRMVQRAYFHAEILELSKGRSISSKSKILSLSPFIDKLGILRVGGRIKNAELSFEQKHPILMPSNHNVTKLLFREAHINNHHSGIQATLYAIRQVYWPIQGRNCARKTVHECVTCVRFNPADNIYRMGDLPHDRLKGVRPFTNVGIDYGGPFLIKEKRFRNKVKVKVYAAIFVCLATKAVHIEVVSDLSTDSFIACLKRFFARRGKAKTIYSDNATNFRGANNELRELYKTIQSEEFFERVDYFCANESIEWKFIPPRAPHFGGIWEAAVKGFKHHLRRTMGESLFTFEEFNTLAIEIEAILNSRPLTPMSADPNDLMVLTPAHFLIGSSLTCIPEHDVSEISANRLSVWQHIVKIKQHFWKRWHKEYLNELQQRTKWPHDHMENIKVGILVLIKEDNLAPLHWKVGRIVDIHPGDDKITRVVSVKTSSGVCKRSVKKLVLLPVE